MVTYFHLRYNENIRTKFFFGKWYVPISEKYQQEKSPTSAARNICAAECLQWSWERESGRQKSLWLIWCKSYHLFSLGMIFDWVGCFIFGFKWLSWNFIMLEPIIRCSLHSDLNLEHLSNLRCMGFYIGTRVME